MENHKLNGFPTLPTIPWFTWKTSISFRIFKNIYISIKCWKNPDIQCSILCWDWYVIYDHAMQLICRYQNIYGNILISVNIAAVTASERKWKWLLWTSMFHRFQKLVAPLIFFSLIRVFRSSDEKLHSCSEYKKIVKHFPSVVYVLLVLCLERKTEYFSKAALNIDFSNIYMEHFWTIPSASSDTDCVLS